ncbi:MAG TPA: FAD-binding protein, partial [Chloroflexi bacterium]|nr:FAD-binding protein [Chloroflexota bacterium]
MCGRICYHPCEEACNRGKFDQPVAIAALKRFLADYAAEHGDQPVEPVEVTREGKVAVVGAGPAGLTAAQDLALLGYSVTVYEAMPEPGGMLRYGIPAYRLPKDVLAQEIKRIADLGVRIITNHPVKDVEALLGDYDAVFVAVGAHKDVRMGIEGEDLEGVYSAIEFLRKINMGQKVGVGKRVYVIGGGNTAIDAARSCLRLGADVTILYRRSRAEMPAHPFEVAAAEEEGVGMEFLVAPTRFIGRDGKLAALECVRMELGEPDETGRRRPIPIPGSGFTLEADSVILAIGQRPD